MNWIYQYLDYSAFWSDQNVITTQTIKMWKEFEKLFKRWKTMMRLERERERVEFHIDVYTCIYNVPNYYMNFSVTDVNINYVNVSMIF